MKLERPRSMMTMIMLTTDTTTITLSMRGLMMMMMISTPRIALPEAKKGSVAVDPTLKLKSTPMPK
ncbi:hypothetical protein EMPG_14769 [Blastomyces silverae]|uniref:Uncharacterized protein n=1 Tax=Blastomyces silverae TaxID=2060906 RepID=A0A0H1BFF8_9EURO|nr:hypothetical protein EMPG_14769 [Blastomyces silverae]